MYQYKNLSVQDVHKIEEIDAEWFIHKAWRQKDGELTLVEINWLEKELPNGLPWHKEHFVNSLDGGGKAIGCFNHGTMVGYATLNADLFGEKKDYLLLDQIFISKNDRNHGIGKELFHRLGECALKLGAKKLYICSASAEETVAFYRNLGCIDATEINEELYAIDPKDIQLEYIL
ncbi:GNAT family N-acetyltransferase [Lachnoclostridium phytofermentans]|uniref:GCN5-related N-acetyltransferase n=1 Tax=Lachnoclostridium phytofermentans (strain ATCC 700394 / DSM 18823 / ISDg) TaxID=357809 RepID=A9KIF7_LACP7|nr:GNAT family N-acetyltransferase [Lachnoclostridium phytofermentans]ABX42409.1 GCN5-related N-acetyltransferase [Lachnoclostridium phytofermentans ISDg]